MRIYFEDNRLTVPSGMEEAYGRIDAEYGPTECLRQLRWYKEHAPDASIYTNFLNALSFDFSWDEKENKCTAYIRNNEGVWTNIQDLVDRELRFAHNIPKMYLAGVFDN